MKTRLLIVDDDASIRESLAERFLERYAIATAASGDEALEALRRGADVALLDLSLPRGDGISVLERMREEGLETTVIVITAHGTVEKAVAAMRAGAYDFLEKPFPPDLVEEAVRRARERARLVRTNRALRAAAPDADLVALDPRMTAVLATARKAASSAATVLLLGESGTGKEVLARAIHRWSDRADGPFVAVNCAALTESLLESELFGHEKGAFTGATARKEGKLEAAHGGTLFLDEIGDTSPEFQVKLLRVLEDRTFERVGGTRQVEVDLRVLAATNRELKEAALAGGFREDLYYRLAVITLTLPPLRERADDIVALAEQFVGAFKKEVKRGDVRLSDAARRALHAYAWPGNVRELRNAIERAVVLCEGDEILVEDLPADLLDAAEDAPPRGFHAQVEAFRKATLAEALAAHGKSQTKAAESLGLQRTYLARLVKKYGL